MTSNLSLDRPRILSSFFLASFSFFFSFLAHSQAIDLRPYFETESVAREEWSVRLRPGDVVLLSLNCWSCQMIESEIQAPFSHTAVVMDIMPEGEILLAQALGQGVEKIELSTLLRWARKESDLFFVRPRFSKEVSSEVLTTHFFEHFNGLPFDPLFLWDNESEEGEEKLYCSEFIIKFLRDFIDKEMTPFEMDYSRHWNYWTEYFRPHPVPQGQPGVSPADFLRMEAFSFLFRTAL